LQVQTAEPVASEQVAFTSQPAALSVQESRVQEVPLPVKPFAQTQAGAPVEPTQEAFASQLG
jgi:hypothetical protein